MGNSISTPKHLKRSANTRSVIFTFEDYTHDAPDDEKIRREVGALQVAISEHCRDYYHDRPIQRAPTEIETILLREKDRFPTLSTVEFSHLLCDGRTRMSALNCLLAHMVIKNIGFFGRKTTTLLSPSAVGCISEFGFGDPEVILSEEEEVAFTQWRAVTAHLLPKVQKRPTRFQNLRIDRLVTTVDETLVHFSDSTKDNAERLRSLRGIVEKGAVVGEMVFASPSRWKFDWHASRRDLRSRDRRSKDGRTQQNHQAFDQEGKVLVVVCFPALVQFDAKDTDGKRGPVRARRGEYDGSAAVSAVLGEVRRFVQIANPAEQPPVLIVPRGSHVSLQPPALGVPGVTQPRGSHVSLQPPSVPEPRQ